MDILSAATILAKSACHEPATHAQTAPNCSICAAITFVALEQLKRFNPEAMAIEIDLSGPDIPAPKKRGRQSSAGGK